MFRTCCVLAGLALALTTLGCGGGSVKEEVIQIKVSSDPMSRVTPILQRYADGQPMSSEATSFPKLVEDVRKVDQAKAQVLEAGLAEIQKVSPQARPAKAKELLKKLQPAEK